LTFVWLLDANDALTFVWLLDAWLVGTVWLSDPLALAVLATAATASQGLLSVQLAPLPKYPVLHSHWHAPMTGVRLAFL
jgi:hypothetical protein